MECIQKQQLTRRLDGPKPNRIRAHVPVRKTDVYDKASAELRKHLAYEKAIRELEYRKAMSVAVSRGSFLR